MKRFLAPILGLVFVTTLSAQDADRVARRTRIAKQSATITGDRGLFTVPGVETLNRGQFSAGGGWGNSDRTPLDLDVNSFPVFGSFGLHGRLTVTGTFEVKKQITARNLAQFGFNTSYPFVNDRFAEGIGDTTLAAKFRMYRMSDNVGGVSVRGFVKFGTADPAKGLGTGRTDVGADLVFSSSLPFNFMLHSTLGYTLTSDTTEPRVLGIKDEMRSGLGFAWPADSPLQLIAEYATLTYMGGGSNNPSSGVQGVSDLSGGVRFSFLDQGLTLNAGYRANTKFDFSFPGNTNRHGMIFSLSFTNPVRLPANNRLPVLVLESTSDEVPVGGTATITATGFDADNDTLTYSWSSSGGQIVGSGDKATFNAAGLAPGKYTVRALAQDGRGGTATSLIDLTVR